MSEETDLSVERSERKEIPIERGFPIERINELAEKENRAKQWYRPIYTMHKWWARRLGCVFRAISLYTLLDDPEDITVQEPGENGSLSDFGAGHNEIQSLLENVDMADPESLWELYSKDVQVKNKKVLDPFMGGGTSLVESSRFDAEVVGNDLNPVAWFVSKKELEAGNTDIDEIRSEFEKVKNDVSEDILGYYRTNCPNGDHKADIMYCFWHKELDCVSCGTTVPLVNDYRLGNGRYENDDKYNVTCPDCYAINLVDDWHSETLCNDCGHSFNPEKGTASQGKYTCGECGQKYSIIDAIQEQNGFETKFYAIEYYCRECESSGEDRSVFKGYKQATKEDVNLYEDAVEEWNNSEQLHEYVPQEEIPLGILTDSSKFEGAITGGHNILRHGYSNWIDLFNERQLLSLSKILKSIDNIEDKNIREYLLLAFSDALKRNNMMVVYDPGYNKITNLFKTNAFRPPLMPVENNVWGTKQGSGTFTTMIDMVLKGVEYAKSPTERYVVDGETKETPPFNSGVQEAESLHCGDARNLDYENEFDAVLTDPPYYDNIIYSELSDYFYVWQRILLEDEYEHFKPERTPSAESIVANPAEGKGADEFENELAQSFETIHQALKSDGCLVFTYHHNDVESWGELLEALCAVGFEVTATYPISADTNKFIQGEAVEFDIVIVARPAEDRQAISWNTLRRNIYRTAMKTREQLENNRDLSQGDIGVIEMGECFHEYSKHHGKVMRAGEEMTAKEVVEEIYGVIQEGSDIGEIDVFLDLLETSDATYNDLNKLTRGTNASPEQMADMRLYRTEGGEFILGTWEDEKRMAYIQERINGNGNNTPNTLDMVQFLRYRYEQGKSTQNYLEKWNVNDELRELCEGLADATGDDTYRRILGADSTFGDFS